MMFEEKELKIIYVSSVNIISGKDGKEISNQIVNLSQLREEIKTKQDLLNPF